MPSPILVGVDPERSSAEQVALGSVLARAFGAPLLLVSVYLNNQMTSSPLMRKVARDQAETALQTAAEGTQGDEVAVRAIGAHSPAAGLYDVAVATETRMLVVGSTHRGPVGRVVLGAVTDNLFSGAPCAVALAPRDVVVGAIQRIGVAFEDTLEGHAALLEAAAVAADTGAGLEAWSVVSQGEDAEERTRRAQAALTKALAGAGADAKSHVQEGDPASVLTSASASLDALVCGSRGYGPITAVLLGSVTRSLAQQAQCALIVVPHAVSAG